MANPSIPSTGERLPSGTVTFLFTDIEGSTRLLQRLGEKCADLLAEQQQLVREACEMHEGSVVGTQGDSFFVAFSSAVDAIKAVMGAQRALAAHAWPEGVSVRRSHGLAHGRATNQPVKLCGHRCPSRGCDTRRARRTSAALAEDL